MSGDEDGGASGHRERLRERLLTAGPDALADHELLEATLFLAIPRKDTKPIARALIARFGSYANALAASPEALQTVPGVGRSAAAALKSVHAAAVRLVRAEVQAQPVLDDWDRLTEYLTACMAREPVEQFRILFLDSRNRLIRDEVQGRGTVNHTPAYPREVVKRALDLNATGIVLAHNHPSGDPTPSSADIQVTGAIAAAAQPIGIVLHDHVVVGRSGWLSFRQQGLLR